MGYLTYSSSSPPVAYLYVNVGDSGPSTMHVNVNGTHVISSRTLGHTSHLSAAVSGVKRKAGEERPGQGVTVTPSDVPNLNYGSHKDY